MSEESKLILNKTILYIEDEEDLAVVTAVRLRRLGYKAFYALDGKSGIQKVKEMKPDLVLLDIKLPDMTGYEVFRRLRRDPDISNIPVIFITADTGLRVRERTAELGAGDFIFKPYTTGLLKDKVEKQLSRAA